MWWIGGLVLLAGESTMGCLVKLRGLEGGAGASRLALFVRAGCCCC